MEDFFYNLDGTKSLLKRIPNFFCLGIPQTRESASIVKEYHKKGQLKENRCAEGDIIYLLQTKENTTIAQLRKGISFEAVKYITPVYDNAGYICCPSDSISVGFNRKISEEELSNLIREYELHSPQKWQFCEEDESMYSFIVPAADDGKTIIVAQKMYEQGNVLFAEPNFFSEFKRR